MPLKNRTSSHYFIVISKFYKKKILKAIIFQKRIIGGFMWKKLTNIFFFVKWHGSSRIIMFPFSYYSTMSSWPRGPEDDGGPNGGSSRGCGGGGFNTPGRFVCWKVSKNIQNIVRILQPNRSIKNYCCACILKGSFLERHYFNLFFSLFLEHCEQWQLYRPH